MRKKVVMPWMIGPPVMRRLARNYLVGSSLMVVMALGIVIVRDPLELRGQLWSRYLPMVLGMLPLAVFLPITTWINRRMRRQFHEADGRLCTHCAYNVGPLGDSGICPECGERFDAAADAQTWSKIGYKRAE